jgi:hypothetical protein
LAKDSKKLAESLDHNAEGYLTWVAYLAAGAAAAVEVAEAPRQSRSLILGQGSSRIFMM